MSRCKILCAVLSGVLLMASAWAQNPSSVIVTENGQLWEKTVINGRLAQKPLSGSNSVMYLYGRAPVTGEILFAQDENNKMKLMLTDMAGNTEQDMQTEVLWATWSPSGDQFIYYTNEGALYRVQDSARQLLTSGVAAAAFSPDGQSLALIRTPELNADSNGKNPGLWIYDLRTGQERLVSERYNGNLSMVGYAPRYVDDQHILFLADDGPTPFWLADLSKNEVQPLRSNLEEFPLPTNQFFFTPDGQTLLFGSDRLDAPTNVWAVGLTNLASGSFDHVTLVGEGNPLGFSLDGQQFLMTSEEGVLQVNLKTFAPEKVAELPEDEDVVNGPPALYTVKFNGPIHVASWTPTSWFSHNSTRPFDDGGPFRFDCLNFGRTGHFGTDMGAGLGTRIDASTNGVVDVISGGCGSTTSCQTTSTSCGGGFGNYVRMRYSNGAQTYYAHQSGFANIRTGQNVDCNTQLGRVGSTGNSTGCHLHFEVRFTVGGRLRPIDPYAGSCNWTRNSLWFEFNHPFHCGRS